MMSMLFFSSQWRIESFPDEKVMEKENEECMSIVSVEIAS